MTPTDPSRMSVPTLSSRILTSVQFSHSVVSNSLQPHGPQYARPPCLSPTPGVYPNSCPLSQRCRPTISSSVIPFSFCLQSFPPSGFFLVSQLLPSGGQSIGVSASTETTYLSLHTEILCNYLPCIWGFGGKVFSAGA